ncbi:hypothetical protein Bbelb_446120 [Branchiostoma belcheri]|nr:hypothetical protein Bbelb_446120 [Branchiostoma belcheri]
MFTNLTTEVANVTDAYSPTIDRSTAGSSNGAVTLSPSVVFETPFFPSSTLAENVTATPVNFTSSPPALPADQDITEYKLVVLVTGGIVSERPSENQALDAALSVNIDPEKMLNGSRKRKPSRKGPVSRLHSDGSTVRFWRNSSANSGRSIEELGEETIQGVDNLGMEPVSEMTEMSAKPGNHDEDTRSLSAVKVEICEPNGESVKQGSDGDSGVSSTGSGRAADKDSRREGVWQFESKHQNPRDAYGPSLVFTSAMVG